MKITSLIVVLMIMAVGFLLQSTPRPQSLQKTDGFYPATVKNVVDKKCYGCHSVKGKSQDAKDALMWDSLPNLQKGKMVSTLDEIIEVLDEDKMPPEDFLKKYPEAKLLPQERVIVKSWAETKAASLLK